MDFLILFRFIPESLRWLIVKKRVEEAKKILRKIADFNNKEIKEEDLDLLDETSNEESVQVQRFGDVRDLFATRKLGIRTLVSWCGW